VPADISGRAKWVTAAVVLLALLTANVISVKLCGEFEFWLSLIKVVMNILVIALGLSIILFAFGDVARRQPSPTSGATGGCSPGARPSSLSRS
jgi:amino acid transporter, AAT family